MNKVEWFLCTIKRDKVDKKEITQRVSEKYLLDAMTYTEAECSCIQNIQGSFDCNLEVVDIVKKRYYAVFLNSEEGADKFYEVRFCTVEIDGKSMEEKRTRYKMLIQAKGFYEAYKIYKSLEDGAMFDEELNGIVEVPITAAYEFKKISG